jgi:hypothetical protein
MWRHPWQPEQGLPDAVTIEYSNDTPFLPSVLLGWTLLQKKGRLLILKPSEITCQLDEAQPGMLELRN